MEHLRTGQGEERSNFSRTKHPKYSYEGIEIYDIADWLMQPSNVG